MKTQVRTDISLEEIKQREASEKRKLIADRIRAIKLAVEGEYRYDEIAKICGPLTDCSQQNGQSVSMKLALKVLKLRKGRVPPGFLRKMNKQYWWNG